MPPSLADLLFSFTWLALQGFGGVLAVIQREMVERKRWLTQEEVMEDWAVAQIMPGPNVVNLSLMVGGRYFGLQGALARHPLPLWLTLSITALGVLMVAVLRWPLLYILLGLGGIACLLTYRKLSARIRHCNWC